MRLNENQKKFKPSKRRKAPKAIQIPVDGRVTWSKNSFKKKPLIWGFPAKHRVTGQGRIDANTRIFLNNMNAVMEERSKRFSD